jgi:phospholipid/cholesterol/gamma-HCH transport system permease protein
MPDDPKQHARLRCAEPKDEVDRNTRPLAHRRPNGGDLRADAGSDEIVLERSADPFSRTGWTVRVQGSGLVVVLTGDWIVRRTGVVANVARYLVQSATSRTLMFDATSLGHWDSALIVFLWDLQAAATRFEIEFDPSGLPEPARQLLALASVEIAPEAIPAARVELLDWTGRRAIICWSEAVEVARLVGDTALRAWPALRGRGGLRRVDVVDCAWEAGIAAVPIVTVVNVLVGGILAFVGAAQLRRFGASIFVADLVGLAVVREMAAVMTAIIMSGRTGGAYAAQIATMLGNEEIDALQVAGIPVFDYLVLPRVTALTCMMPILYLYGCIIGIIGGVAVAWLTLQLSSMTFLEEMRTSVNFHQFLLGLAKSVVFGAVIAFAGCRIGLRSGRSAAEVGRAATTAVVAGIVSVIALDALFAVCANRLGI